MSEQKHTQEEQRLLTFSELKKQLVYFALAYHKSPNKDIANDASEWADDFFKETPSPELLQQVAELTKENEDLKEDFSMAVEDQLLPLQQELSRFRERVEKLQSENDELKNEIKELSKFDER